jgi:predicted ribosomally synthesized six-cysteine peptide SCIFF
MKHIKTIKKGSLQELDSKGCRECQTSCQSACKTSCTVGNQECRQSAQKAE